MAEKTWSQQQQAIFGWFKQPGESKNLVVRARAGTGKTTTIIEAIKHAPEARIALVAFNGKIADELKLRLQNPNAQASTLHSLGYYFLRRYWPNTKPDGKRGYTLARMAAGGEAAPDEMVGLIAKLASRGKSMLITDPVALAEVIAPANQEDLTPDDEWIGDGWTVARIAGYAVDAMRLACTKRDGTCDFDDQIFIPVIQKWVKPRFDLVVVDEAQDMNAAQLVLATSACEPEGRIAVVGDNKQAIYGFRGADSGSLDRLKGELKATELGLTITYRCGRRIVEEAQALVPDFTAAPGSHEGEVIGSRLKPELSISALSAKAEPGDFVLSRKNAPLAKVCLSLLRAGKRAKVEGRDMGKNFISIVKKLKAKSIPDFLKKLNAWETKQLARAEAAAKSEDAFAAKAVEIEDQAETLRVLADGMMGVAELQARIEDLFADKVGASFVICSSVHKSKGRETERVFVLADTLYPKRPMKKSAKPVQADSQEEQNIEYVAITRAKQTLVWVGGV